MNSIHSDPRSATKQSDSNQIIPPEEKEEKMARVEALSMSGLSAIPAEYVRPQEERQGLGDAYDEAAASWSAAGSPQIPVVDVAAFDAAQPASPASLAVVGAVRAAAEEWGVMHVAGHGIPEDLIDALRGAGTGFFRLPIEDKEAYANDPQRGGWRATAAGSRDPPARTGRGSGRTICSTCSTPTPAPTTRSGRRIRRSTCPSPRSSGARERARVPAPRHPLPRARRPGRHPRAPAPPHLGDAEVEVEDDLLLKLKINYYPRCPQPELAVGVEAHTDVSALSFILTNGVPGLQVVNSDGAWVTARDEPGTLVVHVGDALEILSNGRYTSVLHRGLVNRQAVRVSWVVFAEPPPDSVLLRPLPELLVDEPPRFEPRTFRQHLERKVLKKNDAQEEEEVKKPPVAAQEEEEEASKPLVAGEEEHKVLKEQSEQVEAMKPPVAGGEEHKVVKKEQSEQQETQDWRGAGGS
ncbi:anthocyanidin synthase [Hordeum vulgare]|nr:anthocyanidin synthase [Hordeum vulgare]